MTKRILVLETSVNVTKYFEVTQTARSTQTDFECTSPEGTAYHSMICLVKPPYVSLVCLRPVCYVYECSKNKGRSNQTR